jgi:intracellular sulfur oxidation DsrE/DsrF family protein
MSIMRKLLAALAVLLLATGLAGAVEKEEKVVYHVTESPTTMGPLNNVRNHLNASPKVKIVVVTNGPGIDFLLDGAKDKNGNPYDAVVEELQGRGVQFRICNNTLEGRKIDHKRILPDVKIVPSGVAEAARLQLQEGYAYIKP